MKQAMVTIALILLLAGAYVGGYAANLDDGVRYCFVPTAGVRKTLPYYRTGGTVAEIFFWPAFQFDLRFRPERWPDASPFACFTACP